MTDIVIDHNRACGTARNTLAPIRNSGGAMIEHPILINRPLAVTPFGVTLRRASDLVLDSTLDSQRRAA